MAKKSFEKLLQESEKPVFMDFRAGKCAPCRSIAPSVKRLAEEFQGKLFVVKINVDKRPEIAAKYQERNNRAPGPVDVLFVKGPGKSRERSLVVNCFRIAQILA